MRSRAGTAFPASSTTVGSRSTPTLSRDRSDRSPSIARRLFAGSDDGGENWAVVATLIENCKLCGVDPYAYLADVLDEIVNGHPNSAIDELLPSAYAAPYPLKAVA
jgi:transposase